MLQKLKRNIERNSDIMIFFWYPKCSTCQKAKKWLDTNDIKYELRDIVLNNPKEDELKKWIKESGLDIKKFFNTSGMLYKQMNLKNKFPNMSFDEKVKLLSSNGMLVKRPIIVSKNKILVGFKDYDNLLK